METELNYIDLTCRRRTAVLPAQRKAMNGIAAAAAVRNRTVCTLKQSTVSIN